MKLAKTPPFLLGLLIALLGSPLAHSKSPVPYAGTPITGSSVNKDKEAKAPAGTQGGKPIAIENPFTGATRDAKGQQK